MKYKILVSNVYRLQSTALTSTSPLNSSQKILDVRSLTMHKQSINNTLHNKYFSKLIFIAVTIELYGNITMYKILNI